MMSQMENNNERLVLMSLVTIFFLSIIQIY